MTFPYRLASVVSKKEPFLLNNLTRDGSYILMMGLTYLCSWEKMPVHHLKLPFIT